jgi:cytochrome P450
MNDSRLDRTVVEFDHHSSEMQTSGTAILEDLRSTCPVAWTESNGGYWVVTGYEELSRIARDDATFCSRNDPEEGYGGTGIPSVPDIGLIETDPPRFKKLRSQFNPLFTQAAAQALQPEILDYTTWCIDQFIESGRCDLVGDLTSPVPAMLTVRMLGLPLADSVRYADVMHRMVAVGLHAEGDEGAEVVELLDWFRAQALEAAQARREDPKDDLISLIANMKVDGELLPMNEVLGNIFLVAGGGVDTTTALMSQTFVHLTRDRQARQWLIEDPSRLPQACEEYLRYFSPVQGLARSVTTQSVVAGQTMHQGERVYMSWAAANRDPNQFDRPDEIVLDRPANRHTTFGLGIHRCLGSHVARLIWKTVVGEVLRRLPDFEVDESRVVPYQSIGVVNGLDSVPTRFTPGSRVGSTFSL